MAIQKQSTIEVVVSLTNEDNVDDIILIYDIILPPKREYMTPTEKTQEQRQDKLFYRCSLV